AIGSLITVRLFLKKRANEMQDRIIQSIEDRDEKQRLERKSDGDIFRLYADPLAEATRALFYRLKEIVEVNGRAIYLSPEAPQTEYNKYKFTSTLYRLAAVLGWIRAFRRDRSYLDPGVSANQRKLEE